MDFKVLTVLLSNVLLFCGCSSLPVDFAAPAVPIKVSLMQAMKNGPDLHLGVMNESMSRAGKKPGKNDKVARDVAIKGLLSVYSDEGFFKVASATQPEGAQAWIKVEIPTRAWYVGQPTDLKPFGRLPGEGLKSASIRFTRCKVIFQQFFNEVRYYQPVKNNQGADYFRRIEEKMKKRNQATRESRKRNG